LFIWVRWLRAVHVFLINSKGIFWLIAQLQLVPMSSSVPTEVTIRNFLTKELEKRAVKVTTEWSYTTPIGRLVPDMLLMNGAQYAVETKLGAAAKLLDAIVRLYDYSKYTDAKGTFAILFPEELRHPWPVEMLEKIALDPKLKYVTTAIFKDFRASSRDSSYKWKPS